MDLWKWESCCSHSLFWSWQELQGQSSVGPRAHEEQGQPLKMPGAVPHGSGSGQGMWVLLGLSSSDIILLHLLPAPAVTGDAGGTGGGEQGMT